MLHYPIILGDPGAVNRGARKINRRDERFHESLQGRAKGNRLLPDHFQKRLEEWWLLIGQKNPLYYSAQSANSSFWGTLVCSYTVFVASAKLFWIVLARKTFILIYFTERAIEIWEIISVVSKKDTLGFAGKIFVSTDQRNRKIVGCLLASRF